jgi:hypothetical protein
LYNSNQTQCFTSLEKYAIGEIILLVTGMLIALQANNWNEEIKLGFIELNNLSGIKEKVL